LSSGALCLLLLARCSGKPPIQPAVSITAPAAFDGATVSLDGEPLGQMWRVEPVKDPGGGVVDRLLEGEYGASKTTSPAFDPFQDWVFFDLDLPPDTVKPVEHAIRIEKGGLPVAERHLVIPPDGQPTRSGEKPTTHLFVRTDGTMVEHRSIDTPTSVYALQ
jgi:hypothetical protein